jgi:Ca-activated chloride channel family protein
MRTPLALVFLAACSSAATKHDDRVVIAQHGGATSLIKMTAEPSTDLVLAGADAKLSVRIRIEAPPLADADRPPLHLALVLDTSGSMEGEAIADLEAAAAEIVTNMAERDTLAVVTFSSHADVLVPATALAGPGRARALEAIDGIRATGTTDLAGGLGLALNELATHRTAGAIDRMVLVADGFPNDPAPIPSFIAQAQQYGIAITTLGVGIEPSEQMLAQIAKDTGGVYRYAPDGKEIAAVFKKELLRIQTLVASNMSLRIGPGPSIDVEPQPWLAVSGRDRYVNLGDLAAGEIRDVIVPVDAPAHRAGATVEVLDADLSFTDTIAGAAETRSAFVGIKASSDADAVKASAKLDLVKSEARAVAAGAIITAINLARGGALDQAKAVLADAEAAARKAADALSDPELAAMADRMVELGRNLAQIQVQVPVQVGGVQPQPDLMTAVPNKAPAAVEPAVQQEYENATQTIDPR